VSHCLTNGLGNSSRHLLLRIFREQTKLLPRFRRCLCILLTPLELNSMVPKNIGDVVEGDVMDFYPKTL